MKKTLSLTMDELLTVVQSETLQLDSWGKDKVTITIRKRVGYESGEETILAKVEREEVKDER